MDKKKLYFNVMLYIYIYSKITSVIILIGNITFVTSKLIVYLKLKTNETSKKKQIYFNDLCLQKCLQSSRYYKYYLFFDVSCTGQLIPSPGKSLTIKGDIHVRYHLFPKTSSMFRFLPMSYKVIL